MRRVFGFLALIIGVGLAGWVAFNIFNPTPEFKESGRSPLSGLVFSGVMIVTGVKMMRR